MSALVEAARAALSAMESAVSWAETGRGRPPQQTCMLEIEALRTALAAEQPAEPVAAPADMADALNKAMRRAFALGQTYWQQADSEYTSHHKKADITAQKFADLVSETTALLAAAPAAQVPQPLSDEIVREMLADTREVFDADGPETSQEVRDVIEYVSSWLRVYIDKTRAHGIGITKETT